MKYYDVTRSDKRTFIIDELTLNKVLTSQQQQVFVEDAYGISILLNKAHIIGAEQNLAMSRNKLLEKSNELGELPTNQNGLVPKEQIEEYKNIRNEIEKITNIMKNRK